VELDPRPHLTSGRRVEGLGLRRATITLRAPRSHEELCWYLDETFCEVFHSWDSSGWPVLELVRSLQGLVFGFACFYFVFLAVNIALTACSATLPPSFDFVQVTPPRHSRAEGEPTASCAARVSDVIAFIAVVPSARLYFWLFWIIFTPIFYFRAFLPCLNCNDFEATLAHEMGHVLGFDHPDTNSPINLRALNVSRNASCLSPLDHVSLSPWRAGEPSIMLSMLQQAPRQRTCLTADDMEGLHHLYPACEDILPSSPRCSKAIATGGWIRIALPLLLIFGSVGLLFFLLQLLAHRYQLRRLGLQEASREVQADRLRRQRSEMLSRLKRSVSTSMRVGSPGGRRDVHRLSELDDCGQRGGGPSRRHEAAAEEAEGIDLEVQVPDPDAQHLLQQPDGHLSPRSKSPRVTLLNSPASQVGWPSLRSASKRRFCSAELSIAATNSSVDPAELNADTPHVEVEAIALSRAESEVTTPHAEVPPASPSPSSRSSPRDSAMAI